MIDRNDQRCFYNPIVMHALAILADCDGDVHEARSIASIQWKYGRGHAKHARGVFSVLNGEAGGRA